MNPGNWHQVKDIFNSALDLDPSQRELYLAAACAGDDGLRRRVEDLLGSYQSEFMERPFLADQETIDSLAIGSTVGRYEIIRTIGAGGMGRVYLARDNKLEREVAIKVLHKKYASDETNTQRFIREAKAASALNHPNILTIHEIGETEGSYYLVSEFIDGKTLREILTEEDLGFSRILDISVQIASALAAAHSARIIHRDIKPENIVVRADGYVKVLDFGLAKLIKQQASLLGPEGEAIKDHETAEGLILGTVSYMSPEQARAETVDERTDIFSLGILIYEMMTGKTPFAGYSKADTIANLIHKDPLPLSTFASGVPAELQRIVSKLLRKGRDERYQTMTGLLADLGDLKERITFESKLQETSSPNTRRTGGVGGIIGEVAGSLVRTYRRRVLSTVVTSLLLGALAFAWYWRQHTTPSVSRSEIRSIAVLPFKTLNASDNYQGLGIADALIRRISETGGVIVRPTSAVRRYLNQDTDALTAARELRTDAVIEGRLQRADERMRVSINLLHAKEGALIWAEDFDINATDTLTIQETVAQRVAARLRLQFDTDKNAHLSKPPTSNAIAYEYFLRAVYSFDQRRTNADPTNQIEAAIGLFRKAIEADPGFALAYAQLGSAYCWKATSIDPNPLWAQQAREMIDRADALDGQLAETHLARYRLLSSAYEGWRIEDAIRELLRAQQLNPDVGHTELAFSYFCIGLEELGELEAERALAVDPTSDNVRMQFLLNYWNVNRYDDWFAAREKYLPEAELWPWYLVGKGRLDEARKVLDASLAKDEDPLFLSLRATVFALKGNSAAARSEVARISGKLPRRNGTYKNLAYNLACVYSLIGRSHDAVKWLREAAATGLSSYPLFARDPYLDRIRQQPEFSQFLTEMRSRYEEYRAAFH